MKHIHHFAKLVLKSQGKAIINSRTEKTLLKFAGNTVDLRKFLKLPHMFPEENVTTRKVIELGDYNDLKRKNLIVSSIQTTTPWFASQKVRYILTDKRIPRGHQYWDNCPHGVKIQFDKVNNVIRLLGRNVSPNFIGPWRQL